MKDKLLQPELDNRSPAEFLLDIGVDIREPSDNILITMNPTTTTYNFQTLVNANNFIDFLENQKIGFAIQRPKMDTSTPYAITIGDVITKDQLKVEEVLSPLNQKVRSELRLNYRTNITGSPEESTSFTPKSLNEAIECVRTLKKIVVKAQAYEMAGQLRELEKKLLTKKEQDNNRRI